MHSVRIRSTKTLAGFVAALAIAGITLAAPPSRASTPSAEQDREAVVAKLRSIFDAFVAKDAETLRRTHTEDWVGFKANSDHIVHGLDGYMSTIAFDNPMLEYDFDELEVELYGDLALVWYVATWKNDLPRHGLTLTMTARALDVFRRQDGEWIQAGSHLAVVPKPRALEHAKSDELFQVSFEPKDATSTAATPAAAPACSTDKAHQFDFWIGEWEVTADGQLAGHNTIRPILDGCVVQESWRSASGSAGSSFSFYNPQTERWRQFWVWRNGTVLDLEGGYADGRMVLEGETLDQQGATIRNRVTWTDNADGTVRQHWEVSSDAGATWQTAFDGHYRPRG